jgi:hypothetical protein
MSRRHRIWGKRRRRRSSRNTDAPSSPVTALREPTPDEIEIPRAAEEGPPVDLDRLVAGAPLGEAALREPPALVVEGPEGVRRRRARDARDGVKVADPRRGMLYVGIAVFVALLVFAVLTLIESR